MTCDSCVYTISNKVGKKPGIHSVNVDLETGISTVIYDPNVTAPDFIIDYVHDLNEGFTATNKGLFINDVTKIIYSVSFIFGKFYLVFPKDSIFYLI